ncbi:MAG TPA: branched-chain amino acid ABC transporter permease [Candidatus Dormibacteraeota bacterium]|jgi:branched-chain amino acid transport system permease protein|nr:branched-chain amino acid ABC transporter permease [Candidatus Dormibacteraeota bacterium]
MTQLVGTAESAVVEGADTAPVAPPPPAPLRGLQQHATALRLGGSLLAVILGLAFASMAGSYYVFVGAQFFAFVIVTLSLNLLFGYGAQIVIAQGAVVGLGAYSFAIMVRHGVHPIPAAVAAVLFTMLSSLVVALPALRLEGLYLGIATLAFQFGLSGLFAAWDAVTGGQQGLALPQVQGAHGPFNNDQFWFVVSGIGALLVLLGTGRFVRGSGGRAMAALRQSVYAAQTLGLRPVRWRMLIFAISGAMSGLAGVLLAGQIAFVSPASYSTDRTLLFFLAVIVGGVRSVAGSVLGALVAVVLPQLLALLGYTDNESLIFAALMIVALITLPDGLVTLPRRLAALPSRLASLRGSRRAAFADNGSQEVGHDGK